MKNNFLIILLIILILPGCVGVGSKGFFGTGVSVAFDPRSVGTQIDDSIMQKNVSAKLLMLDKSYLSSEISLILFVIFAAIYYIISGKLFNTKKNISAT